MATKRSQREIQQLVRQLAPYLPGSGTGGSVGWGDITGTLSDQTDLNNELNQRVISSQVTNIVVLTQAAYDALTPPDATTLYLISG